MTSTAAESVELSSFACEFGDRERTPESIADLAAICSAKGLGMGLRTMGCKTFWQMTRPIESYVVRSVAATIAASGVAPGDVDHIVFSTMDMTLRRLDPGFVRNVLAEAGLVNCMPALVSMQQCASSLAAVDHARRLFADRDVSHVIVVAFDFVPDDTDRIQPFGLFGDAVASFMMTRPGAGGLSLLSYRANMDLSGILGRDNFETRQKLVLATQGRALEESGARLEDMERCFSTNFFKPIALFNAGLCGVHRSRLYIDTLSSRAHCGSCDWVINLVHRKEQGGLTRGAKYLLQAFAPGFFACAVVEVQT